MIKNKVQLITYPDSLGGNLKMLKEVLTEKLPDVFAGGVHILPPFPSSGDRGFAPLTYLRIDENHGTWEDIRQLGAQMDITLDLMVNHISRRSTYFEDFLEKGFDSAYADMFITPGKVWRDRKVSQADIDKIHLRRETPFSTFQLASNGEEITVWTTFGREVPSEQIDLDVHSEVTRKVLMDFLKCFKSNNVSTVRLDAVGYVNKVAGTSCFYLEPQIYHFLDWMRDEAAKLGIAVLPEVHDVYQINFRLANHGCIAYDFALPYLILNALLNQTASALCHYLTMRPGGMITMLDCHDGIPVKPDLNGLYVPQEAKKVVDACLKQGADVSRVMAEDQKDADGFDVHQICCTYYSALGANDDAYIAARVLQLFTPGIPQIYYVGLLAGENDFEAVKNTGERREINRHNYTLDEIDQALERPVVQRLLTLIRLRNTHPAFDGVFSLEQTGDKVMSLQYQNGGDSISVRVDLEKQISCVISRLNGETADFIL